MEAEVRFEQGIRSSRGFSKGGMDKSQRLAAEMMHSTCKYNPCLHTCMPPSPHSRCLPTLELTCVCIHLGARTTLAHYHRVLPVDSCRIAVCMTTSWCTQERKTWSGLNRACSQKRICPQAHPRRMPMHMAVLEPHLQEPRRYVPCVLPHRMVRA